MMRGAGGSEGGLVRFFLGLAMLVGGGYLFLDSIFVHSGFHWGGALFSFGGLAITSGIVLIPFIFGVGLIFYNARQPVGWFLACGSLLALSFGIIRSLRFTLRAMTLFELLVILVLVFGGLGLFVSSLRDYGRVGD